MSDVAIAEEPATKLVDKDFDLPADLYIPPDAMQVILEVFEGPLDLLLYLIRKHNLDILDIPVADITKQYVEYVDMMRELRLELAADYLEMAALLTEIKSRMLFPRSKDSEEAEEDPRAELVRRLQAYEQIKIGASSLEELPRLNRDFFAMSIQVPEGNLEKPQPNVELNELLSAFKDVLTRTDLQASHNIEFETLSVRERMSKILSIAREDKFLDFNSFFDYKEGRLGVVVTFLAILEMVKDRILELVQLESFAPIYVRAVIC